MNAEDLAHRVGSRLPASVRPGVRSMLVRARQIGLSPADVVLVGYPKSGSTWLRFLIGNLLLGRELDFDSVREALPPVGSHRGAPQVLPGGGRLARTHEPLGTLVRRERLRVVYLVRDGRDVAVSYYHHARRVGHYDGDLDGFLPRFLSGSVDSYGPWHEHALGAAADRDRAGRSMLTVRYEDLRRDTVRELARVAEFLGRDAERPELERVVEANTKERMRAKELASRVLQRQNTDGSSFVRPDRKRTWRDLVSPADAEAFEQVTGAALRAFGYLA
jgi:hypothetical protein